MSLCLTRDELRDLSGGKRRSRVLRWLRDNGFRPKLGLDGWPRVDRDIYKQIMSGSVAKTNTEPNFEAIIR